MVITPPLIRVLSEELRELCRGNTSESGHFSRHFREIAERRQLYFLDAAEVVEPGSGDGVHLDEHAQYLLGKAVAREVRKIFEQEP